jgi:protein O-GlcNAc transferase
VTLSLKSARTLACEARFDHMLEQCDQLLARQPDDAATLLDVGALLLDFGFLARAGACFERAQMLLPDDPRPGINLANVAMEAGRHDEVCQRYTALLGRWPNQATLHRNALNSQAYDPAISEEESFSAACAWGSKALGRSRGLLPRPAMPSLAGRPLRVGYVSADFCAHTVGLFLRSVLPAHDPARVVAYAYADIRQDDWVTEEIRAVTQFRNVTGLDHRALADRVREDGIDVLVDLSGHTAGSRLLAFVYRPAPVMVSWLGYYATTGLSVIDAVLLDEWHAPPDAGARFVEPILRLPGGRFCYQSVPWMPEVSPLPAGSKGYVTFGSFNNTAKLNDRVFDVWAAILSAVPGSRLILKWRTFQDDELAGQVRTAFVNRGVAADRIELRTASFHNALLKEYADIDIALDPFPFTGGITSCEALWSGVPVVTWPQARVVSRQGLAYLVAIGLGELAASSAEHYVRIAVGLAGDLSALADLRAGLRPRMQASPLCDVPGFTRNLESALIGLYDEIAARESEMQKTERKLLNVGAGHPESGAKVPPAFRGGNWREMRLDIDPANRPDILGTMLDMSAVADSSIDAIYSSHNIEHLYPDEIPLAVGEFLRVLKPEGFAVITCPDLQAAAQMIAEDRLLDTAYESPAGPVTPFDIVYSHRQFTGRDKPFMAHHSGFTLKVLIGTLKANGFQAIAGRRRLASFDLWVLATKAEMSEVALNQLAAAYLPV